MATVQKMRVLIAKLGLDSHYRGAIMVARYLIERGMEVIYLGNQLPEGVAEAAVQEDVDVVGLSCLSGNHMLMVPRVLEGLRRRGLNDVIVLVGGIVPNDDGESLIQQGVAAVFATGSSLEEIGTFIAERVARQREETAASENSRPQGSERRD